MDLSFARYMELCLYEDESGYYESGKVEFGEQPHFLTYPRLLSPLFGWALAERALAAAEGWAESGLLNESDRFTIFELGGGDGCLARDVLDYVTTNSSEHKWRQFAGRVDYVIGELSSSLRRMQETNLSKHTEAGRARVVDCDARSFVWNGSFKGFVFCNELIDAFPAEKLRAYGADRTVSRVHVAQTRQNCGGTSAEERLVPLSDGWLDEGGSVEEPPASLLDYIDTLRPLIADLESCDLLPVDIYWPPGLSEFIRNLAELLTAPGNVGVALLADYGGTSRHVLDPRSAGPHLRVYGPDRESAHTTDAYASPGYRDITSDVDFTEVARLARQQSLEVTFFGHQSAIAAGATFFDEAEGRDSLAARLSRDAGYAPSVARLVASHVVKRFRMSPCYWLMRLSPRWLPTTNHVASKGMPPDGKSLWTVADSVNRTDLESELRRANLPIGIARRLKPCGDIAADLSDAGMLQHHRTIMRLLESRGWLRRPGAVSA